MNITRTKSFAGGGITAEEKTKMDDHAKLWISRAMRSCHAAVASTWRDDIDGKLTFERYQDYAPIFES